MMSVLLVVMVVGWVGWFGGDHNDVDDDPRHKFVYLAMGNSLIGGLLSSVDLTAQS